MDMIDWYLFFFFFWNAALPKDIDYIEIRSDAEGTTGANRSYNYRVGKRRGMD